MPVILCLRLGPDEILALPLIVVDIDPVWFMQLFLVETIDLIFVLLQSFCSPLPSLLFPEPYI